MRFYIIDEDNELKGLDGDYTPNPDEAKQFTFAEAKAICLTTTDYDDIQERFRAMLPVPKKDEKQKPQQMYYIFCKERQRLWKPNEAGYTDRYSEAGKYTADKANEICLKANVSGINEMMIPVKPRESLK